MREIPFLLRRPYLLVRDLLANRDDPDLERLAAIDDPRRFVWSILPHAARTFSACIALLPKRVAEAAAVAYLYCRVLDTYEDLVSDQAEREMALRSFAGRFEVRSATVPGHGWQSTRSAGAMAVGVDVPSAVDSRRGRDLVATLDPRSVTPSPVPAVDDRLARDRRDAAHLLLVRRCGLVDEVYASLDLAVRALICALVRDMAACMRWSSATLVEQGGVFENEEQLTRYCRGVLGNPVLFASRLLHWDQTGDAEIPAPVREQAIAVGEMIQLANITRDIEKDLRRGIAYHPALAGDLGDDDVDADSALSERVRAVREQLLILALQRAPAYRPLIEYLSPRRISLARASGLLMLLFTDRYFRSCARRAGRQPWGPRRGGGRLILSALPAVWSKRWAGRRLAGIERDFLRAAV